MEKKGARQIVYFFPDFFLFFKPGKILKNLFFWLIFHLFCIILKY